MRNSTIESLIRTECKVQRHIPLTIKTLSSSDVTPMSFDVTWEHGDYRHLVILKIGEFTKSKEMIVPRKNPDKVLCRSINEGLSTVRGFPFATIQCKYEDTYQKVLDVLTDQHSHTKNVVAKVSPYINDIHRNHETGVVEFLSMELHSIDVMELKSFIELLNHELSK